MKTLFDNDMRALNESELVYKIANRKQLNLSDDFTFDELLDKLTPGRKEVAQAAVELYTRLKVKWEQSQQITNSADAYKRMYPILANLQTEECWGIFLNQACRPIKIHRISKGGLSGTLVDVRVVMKEAILCNSAALILVHNHPSGNIRPSKEDDRITTEISKAAQLLNVRMMDHVIVTEGKFYSYADEGRL